MIDRTKAAKEYKPAAAPPKSKSPVSRDMYDNLRAEFEKMQKMYSEVTEKLTSLHVELQLQTEGCTKCQVSGRRDSESGSEKAVSEEADETIRQKLAEKTKLLERAKILLTRAAAKEKNLREQIAYLRRRCSELQNVPVIEEASE